MALVDRTWSDIANFISERRPRDRARPNVSDTMLLANQGLLQLFLKAELLDDTSWTLTLTGNTALLPSDVQSVETAYLNGAVLDRKERADLDVETYGTWLVATGTPTAFYTTGSRIVLNSTPASGTLVIVGVELPPLFAYTPTPAAGTANPLSFLPYNSQLLPASFVLAREPIDRQDQVEAALSAFHEQVFQQGLMDTAIVAERRRGRRSSAVAQAATQQQPPAQGQGA